MPAGQREWPALLRLVDNLDPSYRTELPSMVGA
jgi:hypothetical protein